jgi:hypothetical protein
MDFLKVAGRRSTINEFLVTPLLVMPSKRTNYSIPESIN